MCEWAQNINNCDLGATVANKAVYTGAFTALASNTSTQVSWVAEHAVEIPVYCSMIGAAVAVIGLLANIYFKYAGRQLELAGHERRHKRRRMGDFTVPHDKGVG